MSALGKRLGLAVVAAILLFAVPSQATAQGFMGDVYGGIGIPASSDLSDFFSAGFAGGIGGGLMFGSRVGARADVVGEWLSQKSEFGDETLKLYHFGASVVLRLTDPATSSFLAEIAGGAGFNVADAEGVDSETDFMIYPDVTLGFNLGTNVAVFVRGRWYLIFVSSEGESDSSTESTIPIFVGIGIRP